MHAVNIAMQQARTVQFTQQRRDSSGAMHILDQIGSVRSDLAQARDTA
ncbi:Uncharacterised protein [Mycobacteroides abscessus subsp. abscessus]|nr:Uncharacterised protein [Mycobacteroides abscessus subsp. abscessus]